MRAPLPKGQHRRKPVRKRRATPRRSGRVRDPEYMARVAELRCCALAVAWSVGLDVPIESLSCSGLGEVHHMGKRGLGQKSSDLETVKFCTAHHSQWHDCRGLFSGLAKDERAEFAERAIAVTRRILGRSEP